MSLLIFSDSFLVIHNSFLRLLDLSTPITLPATFGKEFSTLLKEYKLPAIKLVSSVLLLGFPAELRITHHLLRITSPIEP